MEIYTSLSRYFLFTKWAQHNLNSDKTRQDKWHSQSNFQYCLVSSKDLQQSQCQVGLKQLDVVEVIQISPEPVLWFSAFLRKIIECVILYEIQQGLDLKQSVARLWLIREGDEVSLEADSPWIPIQPVYV